MRAIDARDMGNEGVICVWEVDGVLVDPGPQSTEAALLEALDALQRVGGERHQPRYDERGGDQARHVQALEAPVGRRGTRPPRSGGEQGEHGHPQHAACHGCQPTPADVI